MSVVSGRFSGNNVASDQLGLRSKKSVPSDSREHYEPIPLADDAGSH